MAFESCESLKDVYFLGDLPDFGENDFENTAEGFTVHFIKVHGDSWAGYSDYPQKEFCVISYDSQGGGAVPAQMADYNGVLTKPADPAKENCDFGGWYMDAACQSAWDFASDKVTADTTLYAKWNDRPTEAPQASVGDTAASGDDSTPDAGQTDMPGDPQEGDGQGSAAAAAVPGMGTAGWLLLAVAGAVIIVAFVLFLVRRKHLPL